LALLPRRYRRAATAAPLLPRRYCRAATAAPLSPRRYCRAATAAPLLPRRYHRAATAAPLPPGRAQPEAAQLERGQGAHDVRVAAAPAGRRVVGHGAQPAHRHGGEGAQREQMVGQVVALPTTMTIFSAMGVVITSAAMIIYPHMNPADVWDPVKLVGQFSQAWLVAVSMFTIVVATLSVNIAANVVSPANDFANAFPKWISFKTGGLITGIIGVIFQPWRLLEDADKYFGYLGTYSGALGSIAAVLIVDYWIIRKKELQVADLYKTNGVYSYVGGWNWCAVIATLLGCGFALGGKIISPMAILLGYAWFVGFLVSAVSYYLLMNVSKQINTVPSSVRS